MTTNSPAPAIAPYPLTFRPMLFEKVWGGDALRALGKPVAPSARIGESWELADMGATSASGAGGGAARSVIANGPLAGRTLGDALALWGADLAGPGVDASRGFPLLIKFLDARENLSVQVHPSPAYAAAHPGANLKTECWYILAAQPGAVIYKGVKPHVTARAFEAHIADGTVVDDLIAVPAIPGECHDLPSGTCHALGAGVVVAEVQTPSDTTFRVFDWGRTGRELHVRQALECMALPAPATPPVTSRPDGSRTHRLVANAFYTLEELYLPAGLSHRPVPAPRCAAIVVLRGDARLRLGGASFRAPAGSTTLVPHAMSDRVEMHAEQDVTALMAGIA